MKIIDCHHHYWDPRVNPHPWLTDRPMIPFRYGDYSAICRPWLPEDHARAAAGWDLVASITMEGEWSPADPLGEARWMAQLAQEQGTPAAHVGQIWLDRDDCAYLRSIHEFIGVDAEVTSAQIGQRKNAAAYPRLRKAG